MGTWAITSTGGYIGFHPNRWVHRLLAQQVGTWAITPTGGYLDFHPNRWYLDFHPNRWVLGLSPKQVVFGLSPQQVGTWAITLMGVPQQYLSHQTYRLDSVQCKDVHFCGRKVQKVFKVSKETSNNKNPSARWDWFLHLVQ